MGPSLDCLLWKSCKYSMFTYYTLCVIVHVICNFVDLHVKLILVFFFILERRLCSGGDPKSLELYR